MAPVLFDRRYRARSLYFGSGPSTWLIRSARRLVRPGSRALELGCGYGRNALHLAQLGFNVTAVDASPAAIAELEARARAEDVRLRTVCADLVDCSLGRGRYDLIVAVTVLGLLDSDALETVAGRIMDALRPGGCLMAEEFARSDPGCSGRGPVSEFSWLVRHYFGPGEIPRLFDPLMVMACEEVGVVDRMHGRPHRHCLERYIGRRAPRSSRRPLL
ncbi:MAG: class I SAM-dependent methyltransferase [Planctomycetota bacterium]